MGEADRKRQREILLCQVSEGLVDNETVLGRTQAYNLLHLEVLINDSGLRCSIAEMSHNRSHNDRVAVFEDHECTKVPASCNQ